MFSFLRKKSLVKRAALIGSVLVLLTGFFLVSCSGEGVDINAETPTVIIPQDDIWDVGNEDAFTITVTASVTDGGFLKYQWYSNTANNNSGGSAITGETSAALTLDKEDYTANGNYYFYVIVTNINNNATGTKTATKASNAVTVTVDGVGGVYLNAQKPVIKTQPDNTFWNVFTAESGIKLTVEAEVTDGGALSYQWYEADNDTDDGEEIIGETNNEFTITKTVCTTNGTYYFYVIVTNTNNDVTGNKTVTATSHTATVTVVGYPDTGYSDTHAMPSNLTGEWESEWGEIFTISDGEFSSGMDWGEGWSGYKGTIVNHRGNAEGTAGYITIQYTQNDWDEEAEDKYYVIYYKDLTATTVTIAGAGSFAFTDPDFGTSGGRATKDEAEATYTVSSGYFAMGSDLTKAEEGGLPSVNAVTPSISAQPAVTTNWDVSADTTKTMTVTANITDGGILSYQWYSNSTNSNSGGTAIGTNSATLSLARKDYLSDGSCYFHVVVTNTNNNAAGTKTASVTSSVATVTVTGRSRDEKTTSYYPNDEFFEEHMTFLIGKWAMNYGNDYYIYKWSNFTTTDWTSKKGMLYNPPTSKDDLITYDTQVKPQNADYIFLFDDGYSGMNFDMSYMGLVQAINLFENGEMFIIIEYFSGTEPEWLIDGPSWAGVSNPQVAYPGEKPYFGIWNAKVNQNTCYYGNTSIVAMGATGVYCTETKTFAEALDRFIFTKQFDLMADMKIDCIRQ